MGAFDAISALRIGLASPEQIRRWSYGEVTRPETLNYRTQKPEKDGLFCERIFGPTRDWSCACGKYRHKRRPGMVCNKCGVELTLATVRRERMGHIELAAPIVHPWYTRTVSVLVDLSPWQLSALLGYQRYLVLDVDEEERGKEWCRPKDETERTWHEQLAAMKPGDLLEEGHYRTLSMLYPGVFHAKTGVDAVSTLLNAIDLDDLAAHLHDEIDAHNTPSPKILKRLQVVEAFRSSGQNPGCMVFTVLPVLPPELRPLLILDGDRIASSDLNDLYCRVINRNTRLKRFLDLHAPEVILNNERRLLQDACHALFDNAHKKKRLTGSRSRPLKSLTDVLQGKQGRFRRNLLGKRVDYSGRSVIVVGPTLLLHECGIPKEMACELFKPFLMSKLLQRQLAQSPKAAKRMVERQDGHIWDLLDEVLFERVVLLNRAPTLHRLGILAFQPRLIDGKAIQLHPLVCSAFNADFDGDQMAIHVPLSEAAQEEARCLLLSTRNLRHPASGEPSISPSQEIVLGCFYLTEDRPTEKQARHVFTDRNEAVLAHATGQIDLHIPIVVRVDDQQIYNTPTQQQAPRRGRIETTVGRLLFNEILPQPLRYRNYPMNKEALKALIAESLSRCGEDATVQLLDEMKRLGYQYATKSGISFAISDITIPPEREALIEQGHKRVEEVDALYHAGEVTDEEWYRQVIEIWTEVTEQVSEKLKEALDPYGTIMTIVKSGATKAKFQQIRQLSGIRGLMASPSGKILPIPVLSNYLLGLLVWEIFIAASGARKGFMDRSLNTAMSGYLTRRLVEAGMEAIITQEDCHTTEGLLMTHEEARRLGLATMRTLIIGRVLAKKVGNLEAGTFLDGEVVDKLLASGVECIRVRSPLSCQTPYGLCSSCYGADVATGHLVCVGTAVGVLAGQAIGEPGTQLTMRTFHAGGIANNAADITLGLPRVNDLFEMHIPAQAAPMAEKSGRVKVIEKDSSTGGYRIHFVSNAPEERDEWISDIPFGRTLTVQPGQTIEQGMPLTEGPLNPQEILRLLGQEAAQRYLINEVQQVYKGTGAVIHTKHLEVIVRQMSRYVIIVDAGDTDFLAGSIVDRFVYIKRVAALLAQGGSPARARPLLLGLTKTVLQTQSWIAAASFQDMSRVLAQAAIHHQQDDLIGLKERLVIGKKLPVIREIVKGVSEEPLAKRGGVSEETDLLCSERV